MSVKERIRAAFHKREWLEASIALDAARMTVSIDHAARGKSAYSVKWSDVCRVTAYKVDRLIVDDVCLLFETADRRFVVTEEAAGWDELLEALPSRLPGCWTRREILDAVVKPPFEANATVVFDRND